MLCRDRANGSLAVLGTLSGRGCEGNGGRLPQMLTVRISLREGEPRHAASDEATSGEDGAECLRQTETYYL